MDESPSRFRQQSIVQKHKKDNPHGLSFCSYLMVQTGDISLPSVSFVINKLPRTPSKTAGHSLRTCASRSHDTSDW